jgi:hypothetical protein
MPLLRILLLYIAAHNDFVALHNLETRKFLRRGVVFVRGKPQESSFMWPPPWQFHLAAGGNAPAFVERTSTCGSTAGCEQPRGAAKTELRKGRAAGTT